MPGEIRRIDYYYVTVPDKPGEGSRILAALHQAGINLLGVSAFPHGARKSQLDLVPEDSAAFTTAAKTAGLTLSKKKSGFLIQGEDRPGAVAEIAGKLLDANINIASVQAFCASSGRYGGMLWVKPPEMRKAAKALGGSESRNPGSRRFHSKMKSYKPKRGHPRRVIPRAEIPTGRDDMLLDKHRA